MRFLLIAIAAMLLLLPSAAAPAQACGAALHSAKAAFTDLSAKKRTKHHKKPKMKKEKVEYMRAVPLK